MAQELPPITNYTPIDYGAGNQNWAITQSNEKNIYIANNSGLLEFNGALWRLHPSPNGYNLRSVRATGDLVYTGCYMEFDFWKRNDLGNLMKDKTNMPLNLINHRTKFLNFD